VLLARPCATQWLTAASVSPPPMQRPGVSEQRRQLGAVQTRRRRVRVPTDEASRGSWSTAPEVSIAASADP
jgi:hypothetical protein